MLDRITPDEMIHVVAVIGVAAAIKEGIDWTQDDWNWVKLILNPNWKWLGDIFPKKQPEGWDEMAMEWLLSIAAAYLIVNNFGSIVTAGGNLITAAGNLFTRRPAT
jgi:hypothetical protein